MQIATEVKASGLMVPLYPKEGLMSPSRTEKLNFLSYIEADNNTSGNRDSWFAVEELVDLQRPIHMMSWYRLPSAYDSCSSVCFIYIRTAACA